MLAIDSRSKWTRFLLFCVFNNSLSRMRRSWNGKYWFFFVFFFGIFLRPFEKRRLKEMASGSLGIFPSRGIVQIREPTNSQCWKSYHLISSHHEGRLGTAVDFATSFLHFLVFSTALWDLAISRPVHSLMLYSHLFLCLPCLLPPFTVPCKMVLARPDEERHDHHCSLRLFTVVRRSSCGPTACWILARTSSLVTWSLHEMRSILR